MPYSIYENVTTNMQQGGDDVNQMNFRELLSSTQVFAPCVHDCLSAKAAELCGYNGLMLSGGMTARSMAGYPDLGVLSLDELVWVTDRITSMTPLPLVIDAENGMGEGPLNAYRTAYRLAKAGAKGLTIEDTTGIRGWGRMSDNHELQGLEEEQRWLAKIRAAKSAVEGSECIIIARTESLPILGLDRAIDRCAKAVEVGADMVVIVMIKTLDQCKQIAERIPGWKMYPDLFSKNGVPDVELDDVGKLGFNFVTMHGLAKGALEGMLDFGLHNFANKSAVYSDQHDFCGFSKEEEKEIRSFNAKRWFELEKQFTQGF